MDAAGPLRPRPVEAPCRVRDLAWSPSRSRSRRARTATSRRRRSDRRVALRRRELRRGCARLLPLRRHRPAPGPHRAARTRRVASGHPAVRRDAALPVRRAGRGGVSAAARRQRRDGGARQRPDRHRPEGSRSVTLGFVATGAAPDLRHQFAMVDAAYAGAGTNIVTIGPVDPTDDVPFFRVIADWTEFEPAECGPVYYDALEVLGDDESSRCLAAGAGSSPSGLRRPRAGRCCTSSRGTVTGRAAMRRRRGRSSPPGAEPSSNQFDGIDLRPRTSGLGVPDADPSPEA